MTFTRSDTGNVLILWDVDHTLIETRGVGRAAFAAAFEQVTGQSLERMPHITGRTEPDIYAAVVELHGIQEPPPFPAFADALATAYIERQDQLRERGRVMPGAEQSLAHLGSCPGIRQSVLTGNTRQVTRIKLETFGLQAYLDLDSGAYGDDNGHRPSLVAIAQARASTSGDEFDRRNTVLIGDSQGDIDTAHLGGAHVIAVAAGGTPMADLSAADVALADLTDTFEVERSIELVTNRAR
ncbi:haloacid dehalogenase-like hydrolase [Nocardia tengchongensis]|uniref:Haloacid dehalogenase-like hydrolase n=1 Tax=Nocardia tengchongensis TaxID=2055889 RepID=A0ABX8CXE1_9NOCA|nr:HAD hydrolase-like protein [Nocardia tengchongensis]QVI23514.1 haloacid dehalogenase-like hydrolase [Nocardia tengchongensis]